MMIPKQPYATDFKKLSVKRVKEGYSMGAEAKELGLIEQPLTFFGRDTQSRVRVVRSRNAAKGDSIGLVMNTRY